MITKSVLLACTQQQAFQIFTQRASEWWPANRRHTKDPKSQITLSPLGRFCERAEDGQEVELGWVRIWEPPVRIVLDFYPGTGAEHPTEVVIRFTAEESQTRITIEHGPTAASQDAFNLAARRYAESWDLVLAALLRFSVSNGNC
jgi:hypothetical protein